MYDTFVCCFDIGLVSSCLLQTVVFSSVDILFVLGSRSSSAVTYVCQVFTVEKCFCEHCQENLQRNFMLG